MIKKILDWILGKNSSASTITAPHPLDGATRAAEEKAAPYKIEAPAVVDTYQPVERAEVAVAVTEAVAVAEVTPVTVKPKFKKAELSKMTKQQLLDLAAQAGIVVKARAPKAELVKVLSKA